MNETHDAKTSVIKSLAIVGFLAIVVFFVWILVQGARALPEGFASLASIAETIQNYRPITELSVATEKSIVNSGESFQLSWTDMKRKGTYHFRHTCADGVTIDVRGADGDRITIPCTEQLSLPHDAHGLFVSVTSDKQRFHDVEFSVAFETEDGETLVERSGKITVVNATIPTKPEAPAVTEETEKPETPVIAEKPTPTAPAPKPTQPPVTETTVTYYPVSYPNGFTDLKATFIGVGTMSGNTFTPSASYDRDERGGLKFEVKNIGTKTSADWTFTAALPSGVTYTSEKQAPLRPNEKVVFTIGFTMDENDKAKSTTLTVTTREASDTNAQNNTFSWSVKVVE